MPLPKIFKVGDRIPSGRTLMGTVTEVKVHAVQNRFLDTVTILWDDNLISTEDADRLPCPTNRTVQELMPDPDKQQMFWDLEYDFS